MSNKKVNLYQQGQVWVRSSGNWWIVVVALEDSPDGLQKVMVVSMSHNRRGFLPGTVRVLHNENTTDFWQRVV